METELLIITEFTARETAAKAYFSAANKARDDVDAVSACFFQEGAEECVRLPKSVCSTVDNASWIRHLLSLSSPNPHAYCT
jgi:hypothetical protein